MMQVTAQAPQAAAPATPNAHRPAGAAQAPFANLLRQSQSAQQATPAAAEPETVVPEDAPAAPDAPGKPRLKLADKSGAPRAAERHNKASAPAQARPDGATAETTEGKNAKRSDMPATEPILAPWLVALQPPTDGPAHAGAGTASDTAGPGMGTPAPTDPAQATPSDKAVPTGDQATADKTAHLDREALMTASAAASAAATGADTATAQRAGEYFRDELRRAGPASTETATHPAALGAATFNPLLGGLRESAPPLAVNVPTPLASPTFAQALSVQMSVLASDGVQHAELHLNPPEMGPVSVQIVIDGSSAQVDFGADLATTRQAIEAGLPELAGALRDAGFTLTGGGVSQHSAGRGNSQEPGRDKAVPDGDVRLGAEGSAAAAGAARAGRTVAAGGVDLYA